MELIIFLGGFEKRIRRVGNTCGRNPQTLF